MLAEPKSGISDSEVKLYGYSGVDIELAHRRHHGRMHTEATDEQLNPIVHALYRVPLKSFKNCNSLLQFVRGCFHIISNKRIILLSSGGGDGLVHSLPFDFDFGMSSFAHEKSDRDCSWVHCKVLALFFKFVYKTIAFFRIGTQA